MKMTENQDTGYIVEVDLLYPDHLHLEHNSFPLAPERLHITRDMLSPYAKGWLKSLFKEKYLLFYVIIFFYRMSRYTTS